MLLVLKPFIINFSKFIQFSKAFSIEINFKLLLEVILIEIKVYIFLNILSILISSINAKRSVFNPFTLKFILFEC